MKGWHIGQREETDLQLDVTLQVLFQVTVLLSEKKNMCLVALTIQYNLVLVC